MAEQQKKSTQSELATQPEHKATRTEEQLEAVLAQFDSGEHVLSDKHVDKYFALRTKMVKAVREDHQDIKDMAKHSRKYNLYYLIAAGVIVAIIVLLLGFFNRDYLGHFFELLFAFLGGTGVGGFVVNQRNQNE